MSISVSVIDFGEPLCTSRRERHEKSPERAVLCLTIGEKSSFLCADCAITAVNSLAFMASSVTGKSIPSLLGFKKGGK